MFSEKLIILLEFWKINTAHIKVLVEFFQKFVGLRGEALIAISRWRNLKPHKRIFSVNYRLKTARGAFLQEKKLLKRFNTDMFPILTDELPIQKWLSSFPTI